MASPSAFPDGTPLAMLRSPLRLVLSLPFALSLVASTGGLMAAGFLDQLPPDARVAIGVDGMTPAQLTALEAAVARYVATQGGQVATPVADSGVVAPPAVITEDLAATLQQREAELDRTRAELARAKAELKTQPEEDKPSLLQRASVLLRPGTRIEYTTMESRLAEPFRGWKKGTRFRLENGQVWRVSEGEYWSKLEPAGKAVTIEPGVGGSFFIRIEGVRQLPRVALIE